MDNILHPSHWFHNHDHHKCLFPFKVIAYKDYNGVHKNKEISFKRGDLIQVSAMCDEKGQNIQYCNLNTLLCPIDVITKKQVLGFRWHTTNFQNS